MVEEADAEVVEDVLVPVLVETPVLLYPNIVNLFGPPQISAEFPAHAILHSALPKSHEALAANSIISDEEVVPSGAGPPPLRRELSQ